MRKMLYCYRDKLKIIIYTCSTIVETFDMNALLIAKMQGANEGKHAQLLLRHNQLLKILLRQKEA